MKIISLTLILIAFAVILGCEKDNKTVVIPEDLSQYEVFDVHVQKFSDKTPVGNCNLSFFKTTWGQSGRTYKDSFIYSGKTNLEGNGSFKVPKVLIKDSSNIFYYLSSYQINSLNEIPYSAGILVYNNGRTNNKLIEVTPLCRVYINSENAAWNSLKIDSIIIANKNYYARNLYNQWQQVEFEADCSETNTIKYYYYSNGVKSKEYTKDVYVPYSSQGLDIVTCTLDFK